MDYDLERLSKSMLSHPDISNIINLKGVLESVLINDHSGLSANDRLISKMIPGMVGLSGLEISLLKTLSLVSGEFYKVTRPGDVSSPYDKSKYQDWLNNLSDSLFEIDKLRKNLRGNINSVKDIINDTKKYDSCIRGKLTIRKVMCGCLFEQATDEYSKANFSRLEKMYLEMIENDVLSESSLRAVGGVVQELLMQAQESLNVALPRLKIKIMNSML